jgi:hypothetical protein
MSIRRAIATWHETQERASSAVLDHAVGLVELTEDDLESVVGGLAVAAPSSTHTEVCCHCVC